MFSEIGQNQQSLLDLKQDFYQHLNCDISRTAIHKRFNINTVSFLKELLFHQLSLHLFDNCEKQDDLKVFKRINIKDSTKFILPKALSSSYPGFGGFNKTSGLMNIQYEYDIKSGNWLSLELTKATRNDQQDSKETINDIQQGDLIVRDLGYVTFTFMKAAIKNHAFFLNRLPKNMCVFERVENNFTEINWNKIDKVIKGQNQLDITVYIGRKEKLPVRLYVEKVPKQVYEQRIRKANKSGKSNNHRLSKEYKTRCKYNLFITNASQEILPTNLIADIYKLRWQIEIIFKTWKSVLSIHKTKKMNKERFESQLLAKMLWILLNWKLLQVANKYIQTNKSDKGCSYIKFFKQMKKYSFEIRQIILCNIELKIWLIERFLSLIPDCLIEVKKGKKSLYQRYNNVKCGLS